MIIDNIEISFETDVSLSDESGGEDCEYLRHYIGEIYIPNEDDTKTPVGRITLYLAQMRRAPLNPYDDFDAIDAGMERIYAELMFTKKPKDEVFNKNVYKICPDVEYNPDFIIIDYLQLNKQYAGQGIGKKVVERTLKILGYKYAFAAIIACPVNFLDKAARNREITPAEDKKVRKFWTGCGFVPIKKGSDAMILPLSIDY